MEKVEESAAPAGRSGAPATPLGVEFRSLVRRSWLVVLLGAVVLLAGVDGLRARADTTTSVRDLLLNPGDISGDALLDLGASTFDAAVAEFVPESVPLTIPGLDGLGPVNMPDSTVTVTRPDSPLQVEGWKITIESAPELDISVPAGSGTPKVFDVTIELAWEDADGDLSPTVSTRIATSSPVSVAEALRFSGMLDADATPTDSIATDTVLTNFAVDVYYDGDGTDARQSFDITATTTFGDDVAVAFLISWESVGGDERTISGLRVESPDPNADHVTLGKMFGGDWGFIASRLKFPEFVVARVDGLAAGETIGRNDLRIGSIPLKFFAGCNTETCRSELPEDVELDGDLAIVAEFDVASLDQNLRNVFDPPAGDTTIDLYGKIGGTFSTVDGDDLLTISKVALRVDIPESGGLNSSLPEWFRTGAWTLRFTYDDDPLVGGITASAETELRIDVDGDGTEDAVFEPVLATFTRTTDGTINMGLAATASQTWNDPFGLEWLDLTALEIGGSILLPDGKPPVIDAALISTFQLCDDPCTDPSVGNVELRLAVIDDAEVQFRISFGDDDAAGTDTTVPIGHLLGPIAEQFGVTPTLAEDIEELVLDDLVFAVTVDTSANVVFEAMASANLPLLGDITSYLYVDYRDDQLGFFFGAKPSDGSTTLGELLAMSNPDAAPPALLETVSLPTLGIVATPFGDFEKSDDELTRDGFEFFADLHGCRAALPADPPPAPETCTFTVDLDPGVNLVANITFPGELSDLAEMLWLDPSSGLQFRGTLDIPGLATGDSNVGLGLRLTLPRLDPGDAIEFIEDGALTIGIEAQAGDDPRIELFLRGDLNTRWRRGEDPVAAGAPCPLLSTPLPLYEDPANGDTSVLYCYDRLAFGIESALALTPGGLSVSLEGSLKSEDGWQHPFGAPGLEWLVVNDLVAKLTVSVPGPAGAPVGVDFGFLGDITIDNGDPDLANTTLRASFSAGAGFRTLPNPPFVAITPNFTGVRAYVSRLGMADAVLLQEMIAGQDGGFDLTSLPDLEFQNVELMFSIGSDPDLCLEPRIGIAGELWIDPVRDGAGGSVPEGDGCAPFGALVDPVQCIENRELGCFASTKVTVGLDGIFASGSVGSFGFGPVSFDDALVDLRVKIGEAPVLAVSGGAAVDGLGSGRLAMKIALKTPTSAELEFFGYLSAFDAFEAQVEGTATVGVDPLWVPTLDGDLALRVALRADFEEFVRAEITDRLRSIADGLDELDEALELLAQNPIGNLAEARDALVAAGVEVPEWMNGLIDAVEAATLLIPEGAPLPTYDQLVGNEPYTHVIDGLAVCGLGDTYLPAEERCVDGDGNRYDPVVICVLPYTQVEDTVSCIFQISLPPIGDFIGGFVPATWTAALEDLYGDVIDAIADIDLVPNLADLGIDDYLYGLADEIDATFGSFSLECAEFSWTAGDGLGTVLLKLVLLIDGETYGFQETIDLQLTTAGLDSVTEALIGMFLTSPGNVPTCVGETDGPDWLGALQSPLDPLSAPILSIDPIASIIESGTATVTGRLTPAPESPATVVIDWGDGTTPVETTTAADGSFSVTRTFVDDHPRTGTPSDVFTVTATSPVAAGPASTTLRVDNVAPELVISTPPGGHVADEGRPFTLEFTATDVGDDTLRAIVQWGDGTSSIVPVVGNGSPAEVTHIYADDHPSSGTPFDDFPNGIVVTVIDDDNGATTERADLRIRNVDPVVTILEPDGGFVADEGVEMTLQFRADDVPADSLEALVSWGDGTTTTTSATPGEVVTVTHTYRDDDPSTGTPSDFFPDGITVTVVDDDTGEDTAAADLTIRNVDPVLGLTGAGDDGVAVVTVQYSDPIGGDPATGVIGSFTVTASDVADDSLVLSAELAGQAVPGWLEFGSPVCVRTGTMFQDCTWTLSATADPTTGIHTDIDPGTYGLVITVTDDDLGAAQVTLQLVVEPEDAVTWYQGPTFAATESARSGSAEIELRSTARDITSAVDPGHELWDPWPGDIRTARMAWYERLGSGGLGTSLCGGADGVGVDAVFADFDVLDPAKSVGVGTCDWLVSISGDAQTWDLATVLSGRYQRDSTDDDELVTVARPLDDFITGGGYLVLESSAGPYAGADGSKANFGFHVKFNKSGTNLQGGALLIVRAEERVYRIKSNAMHSLGVEPDGSAQFEAKANLIDITDEDAPVDIGGGLLLQLRVLDVGEGAVGGDEVGFALWEEQRTGTGRNAVTTQRLLFSSNWDGQTTRRQVIGGGNVMVHAR